MNLLHEARSLAKEAIKGRKLDFLYHRKKDEVRIEIHYKNEDSKPAETSELEEWHNESINN